MISYYRYNDTAVYQIRTYCEVTVAAESIR